MRGLIIALLPFLLLAGCEREKQRLDKEVRRLCAKDGGVKVYETVKLPAKQFDQYGNPQFGRKGGIQIPSEKNMKESDKYYYITETVYLYGGKTSQIEDAVMWRDNTKIIRRSDGKVLGESVYYARRGGDILSPPFHPSSFGCPDIRTSPGLKTSIFIKEADK